MFWMHWYASVCEEYLPVRQAGKGCTRFVRGTRGVLESVRSKEYEGRLRDAWEMKRQKKKPRFLSTYTPTLQGRRNGQLARNLRFLNLSLSGILQHSKGKESPASKLQLFGNSVLFRGHGLSFLLPNGTKNKQIWIHPSDRDGMSSNIIASFKTVV